MRLDFNILWVEDQPDQVKAQLDRIVFLVRKEGFRVYAEFARSVAESEAYLKNDVFGDHIDLVVMDFDLGAGPNGGAGIEVVRDRFPYKDIVFYSASGVQKLQEAVTAGKIQGVFCSDRTALPDTVYGVFEALVKKVLDIDHSRGIVMGATSEIDDFVNESLFCSYIHDDAELKAAALTLIAEQLVENRKSFEKEAKKVAAVAKPSELAPLHLTYTSAHRLRLLRKLLEKKGGHEDAIKAMLSYANDTIPVRNELAHVKVVRKGFSRKLYRKDGGEVMADDMRKLRVALLDSHESFERLLEKLLTAAPK